MTDMSMWVGFLLMLPVVFATALVSACMRHDDVRIGLRETLKLTALITVGITALSLLAFALHYLFAGGVIWK
jgi:hypothetical protein